MPKFVDPNEEIEFLESEIIEDDDDDDIPVGELVIHQSEDKKINIVSNQMETATVSSALNDDFAIDYTPSKEEKIEAPKEEKPQPQKVDEESIWGVAKINVKKPVEKKSADNALSNKAEVKKEEPVKAEPKKEVKAEQKPIEKAEIKKEEPVKAEPKKEVKKPAEKKEPIVAEKAEKADKTDNGEKKVVGKFVIEQNEDIFMFCLYANNGQLLYESREYASLATCKSGIETFKKNVAICDYRIAQDKNGNWKYIFRKGNSIYIGESYKTEQSATNSAESTKRFAAISEIAD